MNNWTQEQINQALIWIGYPVGTDYDLCENGEIWVGLTQVLPAPKQKEQSR